MSPPLPQGAGLEPAPEMLAVDISAAARLAFQSIPLEPLPTEMALLLGRMAVAEALRQAVAAEPS